LAFLKSQPSGLLAILLQQFFSLQTVSHTKKVFSIRKPKEKPQSKGKKPQNKSPEQKPQDKSLASSFSESFISSDKQGGAAVLQDGVTL
jgi:hypothetical protein